MSYQRRMFDLLSCRLARLALPPPVAVVLAWLVDAHAGWAGLRARVLDISAVSLAWTAVARRQIPIVLFEQEFAADTVRKTDGGEWFASLCDKNARLNLYDADDPLAAPWTLAGHPSVIVACGWPNYWRAFDVRAFYRRVRDDGEIGAVSLLAWNRMAGAVPLDRVLSIIAQEMPDAMVRVYSSSFLWRIVGGGFVVSRFCPGWYGTLCTLFSALDLVLSRYLFPRWLHALRGTIIVETRLCEPGKRH